MRVVAPLRLLVYSALIGLFVVVTASHGQSTSTVLARPAQGPQARPLAAGSPLLDYASNGNGQGSGMPGTVVVYFFTLQNTGSSADNFSIQVQSDSTTSGCNANFPYSTNFSNGSTIQPNEAVQFRVSITIPSNAAPNTLDCKQVSAVAAGNPNNASTLPLRTTVTPPNTATPTATTTGTATATPTTTGTATGTPTQTRTPGPLCKDQYEPDNGASQASQIQVNVPQTLHAICPAGDEDWMTFGGLAGKVYTIDVPQMDNGLDLSLYLYDEQGKLLAFNDDFPRNNDPTDLKPRLQSFRMTATGKYFIRVRDAAGSGGSGLTYTVSLIDESYGPTPTLIPELCTDYYEPDGLPEQAKLILIRETQRRRMCPAGFADWVKMFMKSSLRYRLHVDSHSLPGADPVMLLADRDATTILDFNDDSNGTLDPEITFSPKVDGYYYVQIKNSGDIGNQFLYYDLAFEPLGVATAPTAVSSATATSGALTATPTPSGPTVTGTIGTAAATSTSTSTARTATPTGTVTTATPTTTAKATATVPICPTAAPYPSPCLGVTPTSAAATTMQGVKGAPAFVNGPLAEFVDPALHTVWSRSDLPVADQQVQRSWVWGPAGLVARVELYRESPGGVRQVQYFDKARMEITDWNRDRSNQWFVTNGLLVQELVTGKVQVGDAQFVANVPAQINVAGDANDPTGPTYASFGGVLGPVGDRTGQTATATLRRDGTTGTTGVDTAAKLVHYVADTGHNIPAVFWDFLQSSGPVGDGQQQGPLFDWVYAMGLPISEPYWTQVRVGGVERVVLVQAFQRRVLTYTPANPDGWKVELGNVGRHYYVWRYHERP